MKTEFTSFKSQNSNIYLKKALKYKYKQFCSTLPMIKRREKQKNSVVRENFTAH